MKRVVIGMALIVLALLSLWFIFRDRVAQEEPGLPSPAVASPVSADAAAPVPAPVAERETFTPPDAPAPAAAGPVRLRFHDWLSGEPITPSAVVWLTAEGPAAVAKAGEDGAFSLAGTEPLVLAASFAAHLPLLAVVRDAPRGQETPIYAFAAARVRVEFEGCDPALLPADASITFRAESSKQGGGRPEHGQWQRLGRRFAWWSHGAGDPDLGLAPADWFTPEEARAWRKGAVQHLDADSDESSPVAAMALSAFAEQHPVNGVPLALDLVPAGFTMSWRANLPLVQLDPPAADAAGTQKAENGDRYCEFEAPPGDSTLRLAWSTAGSIAGRIPQEALSGGLMQPVLTLARIVHDVHSPPNGSHFNAVAGRIDPSDGSFVFSDLAPGEYQVDAAWSIGAEVSVSAARVKLAAGEQRDLGLCVVRPGPPMQLDLRVLDTFGNALLPESVFLDAALARAVIGISDHVDDPLEPSVVVDLDLPLGTLAQVQGLRSGHVWAHAGLSRFEAKALMAGTTFLRFDPNGDRIDYPAEDRVEIAARFQAGAVPLTLRFEVPEGAWGRRYNLHLTHLASGTSVPCEDWSAAKDPKRRKTDHALQLTPGDYALLVVSNAASMAKPGEVHHYAFQNLRVEGAGQVESVTLLPGLEAPGIADLPSMQDSSSPLFFDLVSINGVLEPSKSWFTAKIDAENRFRLYGLPPKSLLFNQDSRTRWTVDGSGVLVRAP